jgi:hypothetical protein
MLFHFSKRFVLRNCDPIVVVKEVGWYSITLISVCDNNSACDNENCQGNLKQITTKKASFYAYVPRTKAARYLAKIRINMLNRTK